MLKASELMLSKHRQKEEETRPDEQVGVVVVVVVTQEETASTATKIPKNARERHVRMQLSNGQWGYYSGPSRKTTSRKEEEDDDGILSGCVLRMDNGDLYLGSLRHGNELYGSGVLYPGNKRRLPIQRGTFEDNRLVLDF
jgi:hypothetical protein